MKAFKMLLAVLCSAVLLGTIGTSLGRPSTLGYPAPERYRLDASESKFIAHALRGGLLWFKGHDHFVAARDFTGDVELTPTAITPAALTLTVRADSLVETRDVFTEPLERLLRDGIADRSVRNVDPRETATLLFNLVGWTYIHLRSGHRWEPEHARDSVIEIALRGVLPPKR